MSYFFFFFFKNFLFYIFGSLQNQGEGTGERGEKEARQREEMRRRRA